MKQDFSFKSKKAILICLLIIVFTPLLYYLPIFKKGYSFEMSSENLILARNLHFTGKYSLESDKGIVLSSKKITTEGTALNYGNRLTTYFYQKFFDLFGFRKDWPIFISFFLFGLSNAILFLIVYKKFNFFTALIFSIVFAIIPITWQGALITGFYELALFFFSLALFFYFYKEDKNYLTLILAGIFFGLAAASRNAFTAAFIPFFIYEFFRSKSIKKIISFSLFFLLITVYFVFSNNYYLSIFLGNSRVGAPSFFDYGHIFSDPYSYLYNRDNYLKSIAAENPEMLPYLGDYGDYEYQNDFRGQISAYLDSAKFYIRDLVGLVYLGGPLIILMVFLGMMFLNKLDKNLLKLFLGWFIFWYIFYILTKSSNWDHFLEILFPIVLLITFGIKYLINLINESESVGKKKVVVVIFLVSLVGHFFIADKWMFHERYEATAMGLAKEVSQGVNQENLSENDVIAFGGHNSALYAINYYTDKNIVRFDVETIKKLLEGNRLQEAFDLFGVNYIVGYDEKLTEEMLSNTKVKSISLYENQL